MLSRVFDQQYRLTDQTMGSVQDLTFTLDAAGNIDAIADAVNATLSQDFTQDALHRIDYEEGAYGTKDYTYDPVGNRLTRVHDDGGITTQTLTHVPSSNRLATHDGNTVSLDAAGNTMADPTENLAFAYDDHNRMVEAYVGAVLQASYVYNGQGQRVKKVEAAGAARTIVYHYGLGGELLGETIYSSGGAKIGERDYLWIDTLPVAQSERTFSGGAVTSSQFVYVHADQLDTPRLATNAAGTVVWRWDSDAFGVGDADLDPDADMNLVNVMLRFPGQYLDEETGLHYNYFRDYDPVTGRYVESDPIGLHGGPNTYAYALGNPLNRIDRLGLYTSARWLSGPSLSGISREKVGDMGFGEYWTLIPPAIGFGGTWWMLKAHITGVVECIDEEECGETRRDVFNVNVDLGKRVGVGYGITTFPWIQGGRGGIRTVKGISDAIELYRNEWTQKAIEMARDPMSWCFLMSVANAGR